MSEIINTLLGIVISAFVTIKIVDERKKKEKRSLLINVLDYELSKYHVAEIGSTIPLSWSTPYYPDIVRTVLISEVLDPKKDTELIKELYELLSWNESHNNYSNLSNIAVIHNSQASASLNKISYHYAQKAYDQSIKIRELIKKYK